MPEEYGRVPHMSPLPPTDPWPPLSDHLIRYRTTVEVRKYDPTDKGNTEWGYRDDRNWKPLPEFGLASESAVIKEALKTQPDIENWTVSQQMTALLWEILGAERAPGPYTLLRDMLQTLLETPTLQAMRSQHDSGWCGRLPYSLDACWFCRWERFLDRVEPQKEPDDGAQAGT